MNLLSFTYNEQLDETANTFEYIDLHTRNKEKAINQCIKFFKAHEKINEDYYFYTNSSNYSYYGGYAYKLTKSKGGAGTYFLILQNKNNYYEI